MSQKKEILQEYMNSKIKPIFDQLIARLLVEKPDDVAAWSIQWLQTNRNQQQQEISHSQKQSSHVHVHHDLSEEEEEEEEDVDLEIKQKQKQQNRSAVSAEVYGEYNKKEDFKPRFIKKTESQIERIKKRILNSFMFQALDENELQIVVGAMEEKKFEPLSWVIKQGEDGNELYVIDEGRLECYKQFPNQDKPRLLKTYIPGESFGELALLYNAPRQASIKAIDNVTTFALDRATFNNIVKQSAIKKKEQMEEILSRIEILQQMDNYERVQLCDVLREEKHIAGDAIINEGEQGDKIYLIIEGRLEAYKEGQSEKVYDYKEGDYFGELALLKNAPRQATVKAVTDVKLLSCDYNSFKRMMGPLEEILKRNVGRYSHYLQQ